MTAQNRCALARKNAGLSVAQAAKLLGVEPRVVDDFEAADVDDIYEEGITFAGRMAELYGVSLEWMLGQVERHDYATVDGMRGASKLTPNDRDTIAEFAASVPRNNAAAARKKLDCEHERLSDDRSRCLDCGMEFVACRACYVLGTGRAVYHEKPECPITDEQWAEVLRKEREIS